MHWPLNVSNFTLKDRLKICSFFLNPKKFWTMGDEVKKIEEKMASYAGCKHSVFTSSGSTANTLIAMMLRDLPKNHSTQKNEIVFPSTTWATSVAPFIREGFIPRFLDISLKDLSMDLDLLEGYLSKSKDKVKCVFITSLIGFTPDIKRIQDISKKYSVKVMLDNCENHLGKFQEKNVNSFFTSTTSTYFGHLIQSVEGGFIFTNKDYERDYFLMARNHGMTRSIQTPNKYQNPKVDPLFDFYLKGNNFRNTNINAFICNLDIARESHYIKDRNIKYKIFKNLTSEYLIFPNSSDDKVDVPFCLPIIIKPERSKKIKELKEFCGLNSIEYRPIISGNLLKQTAFSQHGDSKNFKSSTYLHDNSFYVGLNSKLKKSDIEKFSKDLCKIL